MFLHDVEIVEQPLGRRVGVDAGLPGTQQARGRVGQSTARVREPSKQVRWAERALLIGQPLPAGHGAGARCQMLATEKVAVNGTGTCQ